MDEINDNELELYALKNQFALQKENDPRQLDTLKKKTLVIIFNKPSLLFLI